MARFWDWLTGRRKLVHVEIVLYTRSGCHLCEIAHEQLEAARRHWGFRFSIVDVDGDPDLVRQFGESVPVVSIAGIIRFRGRVNDVLLTRTLEALERGAEGPD